MMNREELAKLYEKANGWSPAAFQITMEELERFAALVEAHVNAKEKERQRYDIHSCGPDCDRYICVAVRKARQEEREACAKLCEEVESRLYGLWDKFAYPEDQGMAMGARQCADAIRARSNT